jgi:hypothetical protein
MSKGGHKMLSKLVPEDERPAIVKALKQYSEAVLAYNFAATANVLAPMRSVR